MQAVILAETASTGPEPFTFATPRAMLPVAGKPLIDYQLEALERAGVAEVIAVIGARSKAAETDFVARGVRCLPLDSELGSAAALRLTHRKRRLRETFAVLRADFVGNADLASALSRHKREGSEVTMIVDGSRRLSSHGSVEQDLVGDIDRLELARAAEAAVTGAYFMEPEALERIPCGDAAEIEADLMTALIRAGQLGSHSCDGHWHPVTTTAEYLRAGLSMLAGALHVGPGAEISPDADVAAPCWIGANCRIEAGASLSRAIIESGSRIGEGMEIRDAFVRGNQLIHESGDITIADPEQLAWVAPALDDDREREVSQGLLKLASKVSSSGTPVSRYETDYDPAVAPARQD